MRSIQRKSLEGWRRSSRRYPHTRHTTMCHLDVLHVSLLERSNQDSRYSNSIIPSRPIDRTFTTLKESVPHFTTESSSSFAEYHVETIRSTKELLDLEKIPVGSFDEGMMENASQLMEDWIRIKSMYGAQQATKILYRIVDENEGGNPYAVFDKNFIETLLLLWREVSPDQCPTEAINITHKIQHIIDDDQIPYNNMIAVLCKCKSRQAAIVIEGFLHKLIALQKEGRIKSGTADVISFNTAIATWMHIAKEESDAGDKAVAILNRMKGLYRLRIRDDGVKPNILSFSMAINALLRSRGPSASIQAHAILQDMIYFHKDDWIRQHEDLIEVRVLFHNVIEALSVYANREPNASDKAISLLRFMEKTPNLRPEITSYVLAMKGLAGRKGKPATHTLKQIIEHVKRTSEEKSDVKVNNAMYNLLIKAYVREGREKEAEAILREMLRDYSNGNEEVKPDSTTWNSVIHAHSKSSNKFSARNAAQILKEMTDYGEKHKDVQPDKITISSMLIALGRKAKRGDKKAAHQAILILDGMINSFERGNLLMQPDKIIFSQVIDCIAKSGGKSAGKSATEILNRMQKMHKLGHNDLKPDILIFNSVLLAYCNTASKASAIKAEALLRGMVSLADPQLAPDVSSYTTVLSAWSKSGDKESAKRAEKLLLEMETSKSVSPNEISYATVLNAFAKSVDPLALERAMRTLHRMEDGIAKTKPNAYCYASVMECISNFADESLVCHQAENLLHRMIEYSETLAEDSPQSYTVVFNTAMKAIQRSSDPQKDAVAKKFLTIMKEAHSSKKIKAKLSAQTYNEFIRACAFTKGSQNKKASAFNTAMNELKNLRESSNLSSDMYTYPAAFRAGEELLSQSDEDLGRIRELFNMCCEDGLVSGLLLKNMNNFLPVDFLRSLFKTSKLPCKVRLNDLPHDWRKTTFLVENKKKQRNR